MGTFTSTEHNGGFFNMFRVTIFIVLLIVQLSAYARTPAQDLSQLLSFIQTLQADFTQTINDNKGRQTEQSVGRMALERPGKFRWNVTKPVAQLIVANDRA